LCTLIADIPSVSINTITAMKRLLLLLSASLVIFVSCQKKQKDTPGPEPEEITITPLTDPSFIQYIEVQGAEKIAFDSARNAYQITLQADYTPDEIGIQFKLYPGTRLNQSNTNSNSLIAFAFKNKPPLQLQLTTATQLTKSYEFYVKHPGQLKAAIDTDADFQLASSGGFHLSCDLIAGIGTVPESPGAETKLTASLIDGGTGKQISGNTWLNEIYFENANQFKKSSQLGVVLHYGDKSFELVKNRKFLPIRSLVYLFGESPLLNALPLNKEIPISGAGFSAKSRYNVTIQSDFLPNAVKIPVTFGDSSLLNCKLPSSIPDGSYTVSVFENDTLVKSLVRVIARNEKEKAVGQMWVPQNDYFINSSMYSSARKIVAERGRAIFANPFPAVLGRMYSAFDPNQALPDLQLKNTGTTVTIHAVTKADPTYADGTFAIYYGQYIIPADLVPGPYGARLLYPDKSESLPFWNKIQIR
jgi:hypothetical protein